MNRLYLLPNILILTMILILGFWDKMPYWYNVFVFFIISTIIAFILEVLYTYFLALYYENKIKKGKLVTKEEKYSFVYRLIKLANVLLRLDIKIVGYEYFNKDKTYLITPNHQGNADSLIMVETFSSPVSFVAKNALSKIPAVNNWMKLIGSLYLNKKDIRGQIKVMKKVEEKLNNNDSFIIFPEGRRSFTPTMNPFKPGTFKMATKTKVDILPVSIKNSYKLKKRYPWRKTDIYVYIHKPITYEEYKDLTTQEIASLVQSIVQSKI